MTEDYSKFTGADAVPGEPDPHDPSIAGYRAQHPEFGVSDGGNRWQTRAWVAVQPASLSTQLEKCE